jgi:hypothetical protein
VPGYSRPIDGAPARPNHFHAGSRTVGIGSPRRVRYSRRSSAARATAEKLEVASLESRADTSFESGLARPGLPGRSSVRSRPRSTKSPNNLGRANACGDGVCAMACVISRRKSAARNLSLPGGGKERCHKSRPQMGQFRRCWFGISCRGGDPDENCFTLTGTGRPGLQLRVVRGVKRSSGEP